MFVFDALQSDLLYNVSWSPLLAFRRNADGGQFYVGFTIHK